MKEIGGYFGLELNSRESGCRFNDMTALNSGRHALEFILLQLKERPKRVYIPYYTCEVVVEPLRRLGIDYKFYHIDANLEADGFPAAGDGEYVIVNNYFGVKDAYIDSLQHSFKPKIIIDNSQAFYHTLDEDTRGIYSPRKFFGVPDGGFARTLLTKDIPLPQDYSTERSIHLLRRIDAGAGAGYMEFQNDDASLSEQSMKAMSALTHALLESIDYEEVKRKRRFNFALLQSALGGTNLLSIPSMDTFACPMAYPYLTDDDSLRKRLIDNKIFVATYWPNVLRQCGGNTEEYKLAKYLIPLPIDQRYGKEEMEYIIKNIL